MDACERSEQKVLQAEPGSVVARGRPQADEPAGRSVPIAERASSPRPARAIGWILACSKWLTTLVIALVAIVMALVTWDYYVTAPWTRDGRVRVQVASIAPQISGQITELRVGDNQYVHKGDVLYVIDPFDFEVALRADQALVQQRAADLQVKQVRSERRQRLSALATTPEQQQIFAGSAVQAKAAFEAAQQQLAQAEINLRRTRSESGQRLCHQPADAGRRLCPAGQHQNLGHRHGQLLDRRLLRRDEDGAGLHWRSR